MPTLKKRINLTVGEDMLEALKALQKLRNQPSLSAVIIDLTKEALDLQEDLYLTKIASDRSKEETVSHEEIWE